MQILVKGFIRLLKLTIFLLTVEFFLQSPVYAEWPMVGGNPQRTSNTTDTSTNNTLQWYRTIDAFITENSQVIAANNLIYVASSRGLYALYTQDPDGTGPIQPGDTAWQYDSDMPMGNSPTIATINGTSMAFIGSYDKKIHAFNATTGTHLWEFTDAKAGYDANPLVVNNTVYIGNRDGYFYAIDATNGTKKWQYPPLGSDQIGPIHLSPAYKNGVIFFATDWNYAYALNENGTLKWKSPNKLPGMGYNSYWPVVVTDNAVDYVIFSGTIPYREMMRPGALTFGDGARDSNGEYNDDAWAGLSRSTLPTTVTNSTITSQSWVHGREVYDYSQVLEYYEEPSATESQNDPTGKARHLHKPWRRVYTILNAATGTEYTMDLDGDGRKEYYPVMPLYNPGNMYPPVLGSDGLLYTQNEYYSSNQAHVSGWKFGTPYFVYSGIQSAWDEPKAFSFGGNILYRVLKHIELADFSGINGERGELWGYGRPIDTLAPGWDAKLWWAETGGFSQANAYGNKNGIYATHGDQTPIVPYNGHLYTQQGNTIFAFGTGSGGHRPLLTAVPTTRNVPVPSDTELKNRLETYIRRFDANGDGQFDLLVPGYQDDSQFGSMYWLDDYFNSPPETALTLSMAYPYVSSGTQTLIKNYLKNSFLPTYMNPNIVSYIGWARGYQRDSQPVPPDVKADWANCPDNTSSCFQLGWTDFTWINETCHYVNPNYFYALYLYAKNVAPEDTTSIYQLAKNKIYTNPCASDATIFTKRENETIAYITGFKGFLLLSQLAGNPSSEATLRSTITSTVSRLANYYATNFSKDTLYPSYQIEHNLTISRNFFWLTPEAGDALQGAVSNVQAALNEYNTVAPYWFVSRFNAAFVESTFQNLYDYPTNFQARAWILKQSREELAKYLDVPAFERGDLFYIQNLTALLQAPCQNTANCSTTPTTPSPTPTRVPGDADEDTHVTGTDYSLWAKNYGLTRTSIIPVTLGNFYQDMIIDGKDFAIWAENYGKW